MSAATRQKRWNDKNKEKIKIKNAAWRRANLKKAREASKTWNKNNPEKTQASTQKWQRSNPGAGRAQHLKRAYGLTVAQWDALLISQTGRCWLCERVFTNNTRTDPVVDHDHRTKIVRGLAHSRCNVAFGAAYEDPEILRALYEKASALRLVVPR